jgi:hypothetical protein
MPRKEYYSRLSASKSIQGFTNQVVSQKTYQGSYCRNQAHLGSGPTQFVYDPHGEEIHPAGITEYMQIHRIMIFKIVLIKELQTREKSWSGFLFLSGFGLAVNKSLVFRQVFTGKDQ